MNTMNANELNEVLDLHNKWLNGDEDGVRADLSGADLRYTDLSEVVLLYADLRDADLRGANLTSVYLYGTNLSGADLSRANLSGANFYDVNLFGANLCRANLSGANLYSADLRDTNLHRAILCDANLPDDHAVCRMDFGGWSICIRADYTQIGCRVYGNAMLLSCDTLLDSENPSAPAWWATHGEAIKAVIRCVMSKG